MHCLWARLIAFSVCLSLICTPLLSQGPAAGRVSAARKPQNLPELQTEIARLLDQPRFSAMRWGVRILTSQGLVLFERDADKSFTPASNMKLYTTAAALDVLGPDFKIRTSVYASKALPRTGILQGDLILYGRGDPNLSSRFDEDNPHTFGDFYTADRIAAIEQISDQLKTAGLKQVTGNVIGDDSYFAGDKLGSGWEWDDLQFYYGAEVSALTVNDNAISYIVTPGEKSGEAPVITTKPQTNFPIIINHATTSAKGETHIGVNRQLDTNRVEFFGTIPLRARPFKVNIAVHDPAAFAATLLKESLERHGIRIRGRAAAADAIDRVQHPFDAAQFTELAFIESQPLPVLLKVTNKPSQNLHAELLLRQVGANTGTHEVDVYGRPKSTLDEAIAVRNRFLQKAGIDTANLSLRDGSGLSRADLVTPYTTSRLLEFMLSHPQFPVFFDSLPVGGLEGTLENRMKGTLAEGNVHAKTGTLTYVNALSGYLTTMRGQKLIFSLYGNNYVNGSRDVTSVMDQICNLLASFEGAF